MACASSSVALAYYRFERILQDIVPRAEQLLLTDAGGKDRARTLQGIIKWFQPNEVVYMAHKADSALPPELKSRKGYLIEGVLLMAGDYFPISIMPAAKPLCSAYKAASVRVETPNLSKMRYR